MKERTHTPVMIQEVLHYLDPSPGKIFVDATVGTGGHSVEIAERIAPNGRLICIDRDEDSLGVARERLAGFGDMCSFRYGNFLDVDKILEDLGISKIDGILFDLGISSFQLDNPRRGFSFREEGPLDMRMDRNSYISAYDLLNNLNEEEISNILKVFGEERWHNRIAHLVVTERERNPISTTSQLSGIVLKAIPRRMRYMHYRIHPATRTFQAVRIAVNRELEALETAMQKVIDFLDKGARMCIISFQSLEDRSVKLYFRKLMSLQVIKILTPKPLTPMKTEIADNPRSRSAKMRVAQRL
ncbi:MAG: 16S rRNA (cytosine(1402)-N(4))-methyltransferase RsmH [Candidatus Omnitrophica bacterium]|nr:16S rRNA (cytosine(1402)-N(4))-methyltransferase RsmH [Candidatus Omnitrophota bacterium]